MVALLALLPAGEGLAQGWAGRGPSFPGSSRGSQEPPPFVPGELLVRFRPGATAAQKARVRGRHGLQKVEDLPLAGLELARAPGARIPDRAAAVAREAVVRTAEPNHLWRPAQAPPPDDPEFDQLWGLHNTGQRVPPGGPAGTAGSDIAALAGWEIAAEGDDEIVVAVVDTGIWTDHPDLQEQIWLNRGELPPPNGGSCTAPEGDPHDCNGDGVFNIHDYQGDSRLPGPGAPTPDQVRLTFRNGGDGDGNGLVDDIVGWDFAGNDNTVFDRLHGDDHGTHVAGTIAATADNGVGVAGVARSRIMPLKFLGEGGTGTTANAIKALDYAIAKGADVTNNSWGGGAHSSTLEAKIAQADQAGQLFVAAAGNGDEQGVGINIDVTPQYPASYPNPNIVAVAATTNTDELASFSNYGAGSVDLGAPGVSILSTVPRFSKAVLRARTATTGAVAYHTFGLEGMSSAAERQALLGAALSWMQVGTSDPVLVVDDDGGRSFQAAYQSALGALGYGTVTTVGVGSPNASCNQHGPTAATMAGYRAVIWLTGDTFRCTLTSTDRTNITNLVNGQTAGSPRNVLLFGQDIGYDLQNSEALSFMHATLRADFVADLDFNYRLSAVPGSPYAGVPDFELIRMPVSSGGQLFSSAIAPRSGAVSALRGAATTWFDGTSMAAPHVTGVVAHVLATHPGLSHHQVKARIMERGDPVAALAGKTVSGRRVQLARALADPSPPSGLTAIAGPAGAIDLSWSATSDPNLAGYRLHRGTSSGFIPSPSNVISGPDPIAETWFTDTTGADGTTYHYVVRAWDTFGFESASSNEAAATADATPPTITGRVPLPHATEIGRGTEVRATFSEPVDPSTVTTGTVLVEAAAPVAGTVAYADATRTATFTPEEFLDPDTTYVATVTTGVTDLAGNPLPSDDTWSFTTVEVADATPPTISILSPGRGALLSGGSFTVGGTAADDVTVDRVEAAIRDSEGRYWNGAVFEGTEPVWHRSTLHEEEGGSVPWTYGWDPLPPTDGGGFVIEARAKDADGNVSEADAVPVVVDTVGPDIVALELAGGNGHTGSPIIPVTLVAEDGHSGPGDLEMRVAVGAPPTGAWGPYQEEFERSLGDAAPDGSHTLRFQVRDEAGNRTDAQRTIVLDRTAPANVRVVVPRTTYQRDRRFPVAWAADDVSGAAEYRVQERRRRWNGSRAGWRLWTRTDEEGAIFGGRPGHTHCFRVRATDGVGNTSGWGAPRCTTVPLNDGALRRQGGWRRVTGRPAYYLRSFVRATARGATLRKAAVRRAEGAALLFTACPRCGRVEIRWKGRPVRRVDMRAPERRTTRLRRIPGVAGRGVLRIVVLSRNRPVIIEGLGVAVRP